MEISKMEQILIVKPLDGDLPKLSDLVKQIGRDGFHWFIMFAEGTVHGNGLPEDWLKIGKQGGKHFSFEDLLLFDKDPGTRFQEGIILASRDKAKLRSYGSREEMTANCEVVIETADSDFWQVWSHESTVIERIKSAYSEMIDTSSGPATAHI